MRSLKFAVRTLLRTPFVTAIAVLSLALGIGANTAIFSLFNQLLLRPLPVESPSRLVNLGSPGPKSGSTSCNQAGDCDQVFSYRMFRDLEAAQRVFTGMAGHRLFSANIAYKDQTLHDEGVMVSGHYFGVLGLTPAQGRLIAPGDDRTVGESAVVVLSHEYWRRRFHQDPAIVGSVLVVNGQSMAIVGVAPEGFEGTTKGSKPKIFVPITMRGQMEPPFAAFDNRTNYWVYVFARLNPGTTIEQAATGINGPYTSILRDVEAPLQGGMSEATLARFTQKLVTVTDGRRGQSSIFEEASTPMILLMGITTIVLLIACANIANLLLARGAGRAGEMAVRLSIGAARGQLVRQLLLESCLLAVIGGAVGLLVTRWTIAAIIAMLPADAVESIAMDIDGAVLLFAALVSMATGVIFGLFPALHSTRPDLATTLKGQAGQPSGARSAAMFRKVLVTVQIALSMWLLASAGLFAKSLANVSRVDLGLEIGHLVTFALGPRRNGYTPERSRELFARVEERLAATPGVRSAAAARIPLLGNSNSNNGLTVQGFEAGPDTNTSASYNEVSPGFFKTVGVPLLAGRDFTDADTLGAPKVAIVNEAFTRKFQLGRDAVGKRMSRSRGTGPLDIEIVGIVRDAKYSKVRDVVPPVFFVPYRQNEQIGAMTFYARTEIEPEAFLKSVHNLVAGLDPQLPVEDLRTMPQQVRENVFLDRLISILTAAFAGLATVLAAIGLYGVLAFTITQRTREFGLRMALGAGPAGLRALVLKQVAWMTAIGGAVGLIVAVVALSFAASLLFELRSYDPLVLGASALVLAIVALGAGLIPALRASRIDPMRALRYE